MGVDDTSPAARDEQITAFRRMTPRQRVDAAMSLSEDVIQIATEGVRARHPTYGPEEIRLAVIRLRLGDLLFSIAFPGAPLLPA